MIQTLVASPGSVVVRSRCVMVFDVMAKDGAGQDAVVAAGLDEQAALELYEATTGRKWTREALEARE